MDALTIHKMAKTRRMHAVVLRGAGRTLDEIGAHFGVCRERARQLTIGGYYYLCKENSWQTERAVEATDNIAMCKLLAAVNMKKQIADANERSRELFFAAHPEIWEARQLERREG